MMYLEIEDKAFPNPIGCLPFEQGVWLLMGPSTDHGTWTWPLEAKNKLEYNTQQPTSHVKNNVLFQNNLYALTVFDVGISAGC